MAGSRLTYEESRGASGKPFYLKKTRFGSWVSKFTLIVGMSSAFTPLIDTVSNKKNIGPNNAMARATKQAPPVEDVRGQAQAAVALLGEFMRTGDQATAQRFTAAFDSGTRGPSADVFKEEFAAQFQAQIIDADPQLGNVFYAYVDRLPPGEPIRVGQFVELVLRLRETAGRSSDEFETAIMNEYAAIRGVEVPAPMSEEMNVFMGEIDTFRTAFADPLLQLWGLSTPVVAEAGETTYAILTPEDAATAFRLIVNTGDPAAAEAFRTAFEAGLAGPSAEDYTRRFLDAFQAEMEADPRLFSLFDGYANSLPTDAPASVKAFIDLILRLRDAFAAQTPEQRGETIASECATLQCSDMNLFTERVINPLLANWSELLAEATPSIAGAVPAPVRSETQTQTDAQRAAEFFAKFVRATDEADETGFDRDSYEVQFRNIFTRYRDGEAIDEQFMTAFLEKLGAGERAVIERFMAREGITALTFSTMAGMLEDIENVSIELRAIEQFVNISDLEEAYNAAFVDSIRALLPEQRRLGEPTMQDLRERIASLREFEEERGISLEGVLFGGKTLAEWEAQFQELEAIEARGRETVPQDGIDAIYISLPTRSALEREVREAARIADKFSDLLRGDRPFYYTIGETWLSTARSLVAQADDRKADGLLGDFFKLRLDYELRSRRLLHFDDVPVPRLDTGGAPMLNEDGTQMMMYEPGISSTIDKIGRVLPVLRQIQRMLNGRFNEEEQEDRRESVRTMLDELPEDVFDQAARDAMFADFEAMMRTVEQPRYTSETIGAAVALLRRVCSGLDVELQDRVLIEVVSSWHYELGGVPAGTPRLDALAAAYEHVATAQDGQYILNFERFNVMLEENLARMAEATPEGTGMEEGLEGAEAALLTDRRARLTDAAEILRNAPFEVRLQIYELLWRQLGREPADASLDAGTYDAIAGMLLGVEGMPPAYAAELLRSVGPTLLSDYDGPSIQAILTAINTYSQPIITAGLYRELEGYYAGLDQKIRDMFVNVVTLRNLGREDQGAFRDVRVLPPSDRSEFAQIYIPASRIMISVPKRIYEEWVSMGAVVQVTASPDASRGSPMANLRDIERRFFGTDAIQIELNVPLPYIYLPLVLENLDALRPDVAIPVEEMDQLSAQAAVGVHAVSGAGEDYTSFSGRLRMEERGGGRDWSMSMYASDNQGNNHYLGNMRWTNQPLGGEYEGEGGTTLTRGEFVADVTGGELDRLIWAMNTIPGPSGMDTAIYFRKDGDEYRAYVFQVFEDGSFGLADVRTLNMEQARVLYDHTFAHQPWKLYAGGRITGADVAGEGSDWMLQLDGAVLFGGLPSEEEVFQGAGAAAQAGRVGVAFDYEETRGRRAQAMGAYMDPTEREYYVGRLFLTSMEESAEHPGVGTYGEFQWYRAKSHSLDLFFGSRRIGENWDPNYMEGGALLTYLGEGWWTGARGGYLLNQSIRPEEEGAVSDFGFERVRTQIAGGSVYGGADLRALTISAAVSTVWTRLLMEPPEGVSQDTWNGIWDGLPISPIEDLGADLRIPPRVRDELQRRLAAAGISEEQFEAWERHVAAAVRIYVPDWHMRIMAGGVSDEERWEGGHGMVSFLYPTAWIPEISLFGMYLRGQGEIDAEIPIIGASATFRIGETSRIRVQGFGIVVGEETGGGADIRAFFGIEQGFDISINGAYTEEPGVIGRGISGAARARIGTAEDDYRVVVTGAGGYSEQEVRGEVRRTAEGAGIIRLNLAEAGAEPTVTDVYIGAAGMHSEVDPVDPAEPPRRGDQADVVLGVTSGTTDWTLDLAGGARVSRTETDLMEGGEPAGAYDETETRAGAMLRADFLWLTGNEDISELQLSGTLQVLRLEQETPGGETRSVTDVNTGITLTIRF